MSLSPPAPRRDVRWVKDRLGRTEPAWNRNSEPSIPILESIARKHLSISEDVSCSICPFARGAFNHLYAVHTPAWECLIRVTLPVEPHLKTLSEVATIEFVRAHASELVPRVLAYDAGAHPPERALGDLGFEWMIMEKIPGSVLERRWGRMDWDTKLSLVKTVVGVLAKLYEHPLSWIGNIYPPIPDPDIDPTAYPAPVPILPTVGQIVSMTFFWDDHFHQDVSRGPFRSSHDWLASCLQFILNDAAKVIERASGTLDADSDSDWEDELEEAQETQVLASRLARLLPRVFPPALPNAPPERTFIFHDDLSSQNILVDASGALTGIVDWECVSALPLWRACTLPSFLLGRHRAERPNPETYGKAGDDNNNDDNDGDNNGNRGEDGVWGECGPGRPNSLYFEHLLEWERTQLRSVFLEEMARVQPDWVEAHRADVLRNDFYTAVMYCDDEFRRRRVRMWVEQVEEMADKELQAGGSSPKCGSLNDILRS